MRTSKQELTHEQKITYIQSFGVRCPYCRSDDIEDSGSPQLDAGYARQDVQCNACRSEWRDVYALTDVVAA